MSLTMLPDSSYHLYRSQLRRYRHQAGFTPARLPGYREQHLWHHFPRHPSSGLACVHKGCHDSLHVWFLGIELNRAAVFEEP